jgi:hypothetical protein
MNEYRQSRKRKKHLFRKKKAQLDDQALIEFERHLSVHDSRMFYKCLNDIRKPFKPAVAMCRAMNGQLLTNKDRVLSKWKKYFEQLLNECSVEEPHPNQEPPRQNDVLIDFPSRDEIADAIKYLKDNKSAGSDSIASELLKSGGPSLVSALNEMIQQVARHYLKAEPRGYCV